MSTFRSGEMFPRMDEVDGGGFRLADEAGCCAELRAGAEREIPPRPVEEVFEEALERVIGMVNLL